jgi:hypothetical protein
VTFYIDDGLLVVPSKARVVRRYKFALDVFDKAGLLISFEKSLLPEDTSTRVEFLGVCIDTLRKRPQVAFGPPGLCPFRSVRFLTSLAGVASWYFLTTRSPL